MMLMASSKAVKFSECLNPKCTKVMCQFKKNSFPTNYVVYVNAEMCHGYMLCFGYTLFLSRSFQN